MWRHACISVLGPVLGSVFALALGACSGTSYAPGPATATLTPAATATEQPKSEGPCQDLPTVSLQYDEQSQDGLRTSLNWSSVDCAANAHPSFTMPIPVTALTLPVGAQPLLTVSEVPLTLDASVRVLRLEQATPIASGLQMPLEDFDANLSEPFDVESVAEQELSLPVLPPGDFIIHLGSTWPDGRLGFAFRIEIVAAGAE